MVFTPGIVRAEPAIGQGARRGPLAAAARRSAPHRPRQERRRRRRFGRAAAAGGRRREAAARRRLVRTRQLVGQEVLLQLQVGGVAVGEAARLGRLGEGPRQVGAPATLFDSLLSSSTTCPSIETINVTNGCRPSLEVNPAGVALGR